MHINNKKELRPLIDRFNLLKKEKFSQKREHQLDDLFMDLHCCRLAPGEKDFKDGAHKGLRLRCFTYASDDGKCEVTFQVKIVKALETVVEEGRKIDKEIRKTEFTLETRFSKKKPTPAIQ